MARRFALGFMVRLLAFIPINLFSAHLFSDCGRLAVFERDSCTDDVVRVGWPLAFHERGGFDYRFEFITAVLLLDRVIGAIAAGAARWLFAQRAT